MAPYSSGQRTIWLHPAPLTIARWAALIAVGEPIMAIASLRNQRISVYDANSGILRAPVSSGHKSRETPTGIFRSVLIRVRRCLRAAHATPYLVGPRRLQEWPRHDLR